MQKAKEEGGRDKGDGEKEDWRREKGKVKGRMERGEERKEKV
jgi:hypothetical protein